MKKKIIFLIMLASMLLTLVGCAKLVDCTETQVEVTITDTYHRGMWMQPVRAGNVTTYITHPAVYLITVEYDGREYNINSHDTYYKYKDKVGQTTTATLVTKTYDNGQISMDITELE